MPPAIQWRVAALVYQRRQHTINVFVAPADGYKYFCSLHPRMTGQVVVQ